MAEERDQYTRSSMVIGLNFLLFFLGFLVIQSEGNVVWFEYNYVMVSFFLGLLIAIGLSFLNRTPLGGVLIGASLSGAYWIGFLTSLLTKTPFSSTREVLLLYGSYSLYVLAAFSSLGLFFGILGHFSERLFVENPIVETYLFRDYWSNVFNLGKNVRREYNDLDRRLTRAHISAKDWWRQQVHRVKQVKPELMFVSHTSGKVGKSKSREEKVGDIYDISSGHGLYHSLVDPSDLVGIYKPMIVNLPRTSDELSGGRRIAFEELISRFLGWFIQSKALWLLYLATSVIFTYALIVYFDVLVESSKIAPQVPISQVLLIVGVTLSVLTLYFVFRFKSISKQIYEKRPDERTLIFAIYLILFMFYGLYYQVITSMDKVVLNEISLFDIGTWPWITAIKWFLFLTAILTLTYIFIHRECEISNIYLYDNSKKNKLESSMTHFKNEKDKPIWLQKEDSNLYWVLRFMYFWSYEITLIPHPDWERVEVWVDAKTGDAKWIVSDYHYRELWYKVEGDLKRNGLHVGFLANFHTPIPFVTEDEIDRFTNVLRQSKKNLIRMLLGGNYPINEATSKKYHDIHPPNWVEKYGLKGLTANFCSELDWSYWRYPWGIDNTSKYLTYPSTLPEEQPELI